MQAVCPITDKRINEQVVRLNGLVTVLLIVTFIVLNFWGGMIFLMIDFALRGFGDNKYSPICQVNKWMASMLKLTPKMMNAGPKIFAAQVGLILSSISLLGLYFDYTIISFVFAGMLGFFSFLESAFGFCVACKLYPLFRKN